jgi:hypothetical protein
LKNQAAGGYNYIKRGKMEKVRAGREIKIYTDNKVGILADITDKISKAGINIEDICAYAADEQAVFYLITTDNEKIKDIIGRENMYKTEERDVVIMCMENRPGALSEIAEKFKEENIDIKYLYGTNTGKGETTIVFSSDNNTKAFEVANFILSLSGWGKGKK